MRAASPDGAGRSAFAAVLAHPRGRATGRGGAPAWLPLAVVAVAGASHAVNLFGYPAYLGDEGIALQQAWAVLRQHRLSPYTYWYDHPPAGWLLLAWWMALLQGRVDLFGVSLNAARVLMVPVHMASALLLYGAALRLSGSARTAALAAALFSLSPLALSYQRMVLLDNLMVLWLLLALYLLLTHEGRLWTLVGSAAAFALAALTKETALLFAPALLYFLVRGLRGAPHFRFAVAGWLFVAASLASLYPLYALLKGELLPLGGPSQRVSLLGALAWQLRRSGGALFDPGGRFWEYAWGRWWSLDPLTLVGGIAATALALALGGLRRRQAPGLWSAGLLAGSFTAYLAAGGALLDFHIVPALPFWALAVALLAGEALRPSPRWLGRVACALALGAAGAVLLPRAQAAYTLDLTRLQAAQLAYVREALPPPAVLVTDDDLWVDLHEPSRGHPGFPNTHPHWKAAGDPAVRDGVLRGDWRTVDYLVMSDDMEEALLPGSLPMQAYRHSYLVQVWAYGEVDVQVRAVVKDAAAPLAPPPGHRPARGARR